MVNNLKFNNGKFRIMLVGDPHASYKDDTSVDRAKISDYLNLQYNAVKKLKPDLVILMGDNGTGRNENELRKTLLRITKPYADAEIPFAFILGNHDLECEVNDLQIQYDIYRTLPFCILPDKNTVNDFGDYNLLISDSDNKNKIFNLWFMYSGSGAPKEFYSTYGFVTKKQIEWYESKVLSIKEAYGLIPAILFQHIPVPEEFGLLKEHSHLKVLTDGVFGQNEQKGKIFALDKKNSFGYMGEAPCTSGYNSGQFASWKKMGDIVAAFFGHDHMNDFLGKVDGITLGQCKTSGFNVYGDGLMQGVRIIDIEEKSPENFETKMLYYRELVGSNCLSVKGEEKILRDRTSVKLDVLKKIIKYCTPLAVTAGSVAIIKKLIK